MGTVHKLSTGRAQVTVSEAVAAYLAAIDHPESRGTRRTYSITLKAFAAQFGDSAVTDLDPAQVAEWFAGRWGAPPGDVERCAQRLAGGRHLVGRAGMVRGGPSGPGGAALSRSTATGRCPARRLSSCSPARTSRCATGCCGGCCTSAPRGRLRCCASTSRTWTCPTGAPGCGARAATWTRSSGRPAPPDCCPGSSRGASQRPLFLTERRARVQLAPADIDPEGAGAAELRPGGGDLQGGQRRGDAPPAAPLRSTHDAEGGTGTPMLQARSGHTSLRSLERYTRVSAEALARHLAERDPAREALVPHRPGSRHCGTPARPCYSQ